MIFASKREKEGEREKKWGVVDDGNKRKGERIPELLSKILNYDKEEQQRGDIRTIWRAWMIPSGSSVLI